MKVMLGLGMLYLPLVFGALFVLGTAALWLRQRSLPALLLFLGFVGPIAGMLLPAGSAAAEWRFTLLIVCGMLQVIGIFGLARQPRPTAGATA